MSPITKSTDSSVTDLSGKPNARTFLNEISLFDSSDEETTKTATEVESALPEMSMATPLPTSDSGSEEKADIIEQEVVELDDDEDEDDTAWQEGDDEGDVTGDVSLYQSDSEEPAALEEEALDLLKDLDATEKNLPALHNVKKEIEQIKKKVKKASSSKRISLIPALFSRKRKRYDDDEQEAEESKEVEKTQVSVEATTEEVKATEETETIEKTDDVETPTESESVTEPTEPTELTSEPAESAEPVDEDVRPTKRIRKAIGRFSTFAIGAAAGSMVTIAALIAAAPAQ